MRMMPRLFALGRASRELAWPMRVMASAFASPPLPGDETSDLGRDGLAFSDRIDAPPRF